MTDTLVLKNKLVMPQAGTYLEIDRDEMEYVDGGAWYNSVTFIAGAIDLALIICCGAINASLKSMGYLCRGAAKSYIKKSAPKWAKYLHKATGVLGKINGYLGIARTASSMLVDVDIWFDRIVNLCSIGGIFASILDMADGNWNGYIGE